MNIFKRGQTYWCEFVVDKKRYRYSCKTQDKDIAEEVASAIHADSIKSRFNIPSKNKAEFLFKNIYQNYLKTIFNSKEHTIKKIEPA